VAFTPPGSFPDRELADLEGGTRRLGEAWAAGPGLVLLGHSGCDTTRFTLPFVDRLHRARGGSVVAVLQDTAEDARELKRRLGLDLTILLEPAPYALAAALGLTTVPTLFQVAPDGRIESVSEAFRRAGLEAAATHLGVTEPVFTSQDHAPELRPG
jgi:hypothetical protein